MNHAPNCNAPTVSHDLCAECHDPICEGMEGLETKELYNGAPRRFCGDCYVDRCKVCGEKMIVVPSKEHAYGSYDNGYSYCSECAV